MSFLNCIYLLERIGTKWNLMELNNNTNYDNKYDLLVQSHVKNHKYNV